MSDSLSRASTADPPPARADQRLRPYQRLGTAADFDRVFRQGQRSSDQFFTVLFCLSAAPAPRLGFAIARARVRRAVHRNRLRRLVRESFRRLEPPLPAVDIVVMAREAARAASNPELTASIAAHWSRLRRRAAALAAATAASTPASTNAPPTGDSA